MNWYLEGLFLLPTVHVLTIVVIYQLYFLYAMNLLKRIIRLPLVATPVVRIAVWATVTAIDIATRAPAQLLAAEPIARFEIFGIANKLIHNFIASKDAQVSMAKWCLQAGTGLVKSIFNSLTSPATDNQITANNIPNIMAGKIAGNHLVAGLTSEVFVIALSPNMINFLGFLFLCIKGVFLGIGLYQTCRVIFNYFRIKLSEIKDDNDYIDVKSKRIYNHNQDNVKRFRSTYRN